MTNYFDCDCYSADHTLRFVLDEEDMHLYIEVQLNRVGGFWSRLLKAIKYVLGYESKYGHWDCFVLNPKDKQKLIDVISLAQ